ncbi:MAG: DUF192 domain-containing protein [Dehalococcoidia bacterium]|nr:DUF192 domain-containing protein [Dehalococcoidia bacterium]
MVSRLPALLLLVASLALVACGGDEAGTPGATPTASAQATATGTGPSPALAPEPPEHSEPPEPSGPVASTYYTPTEDLPVVRFTRADGGTADLSVEAPPTSEYTIGLSGREHLDGRGMVFYYPDASGGPGFWMRNTHIDLDIAFVDGEGRIIAIRQMEAESEEIHHPGAPYLAGIEAPLDWYAVNGLAEGDRAEFLFDPLDYLE